MLFPLPTFLLASIAAFAASPPAMPDPLSTLLPKATILRMPIAGISEKEDAYHLEVKLPPLTKQEFGALAKSLGGQPSVYDSGARYSLAEFLPEFARELVGRQLGGKAVFSPEIVERFANANVALEPEYPIKTNCHSLSRSWLEFKKQPGFSSNDVVYWGYGGSDLLQYWKKPLSENQKAPGDIFGVLGPIGLGQKDSVYHSAIYLGGGLVLEKSDNDPKYPYRIAQLADVRLKYARLSKEMKFGFYRPEQATKVPRLKEEFNFDRIVKVLEETKKNGTLLVELDVEALKNFPSAIKAQLGLKSEYDPQTEVMGVEVFPIAEILKQKTLRPLPHLEIKKGDDKEDHPKPDGITTGE